MSKILLVFVFTFIYYSNFYAEPQAIIFEQQGFEKLQKKEYNQAIDFFKKALNENPYYTKAYEGLGDTYVSLINFVEAKKFYLKALSLEPENVKILIKIARLMMELSSQEENLINTEFYLYRAYQKSPQNERVLIAYGDFYFKKQNFKKAEEFYDKVIYQESAEILVKKALLEKRKNNLHKTEELLLDALAKDAYDPEVNYELGIFYLEQHKNKEKSIFYLNQWISHGQLFQTKIDKVIHLFMQENLYQEAVPLLSKLINLNHSQSKLYYLLSVCYYHLNQKNKALQLLSEGYNLNTGDELLRLKFEELLVNETNPEDERRKPLARFHFKRFQSFKENGDFKKALVQIKRAIKLNPLEFKYRDILGLFYKQQQWPHSYLRNLSQMNLIFKNNATLKRKEKIQNLAIRDTLARKYNIDSLDKDKVKFYPKLCLALPLHGVNNSYIDLAKEMQILLYEVLSEQQMFNLFIEGDSCSSQVMLFPTLRLLTEVLEIKNGVQVKAQLINVYNQTLFQEYTLEEYGNDALFKVFVSLSNHLEKVILPFGTIIDLNDESAIISFGRKQGIKSGDQFLIIQDLDYLKNFVSSGQRKPESEFIVGKGEVLSTDENISFAIVQPYSHVTFNMINLNQIALLPIKKEDK